MRVCEGFVNATEDSRFGDSGWYEPYTDNIGRIFREMQQEYGRCVSKVYIDTTDGALQVGWVFSKRMVYEGARRDNGKYRESDHYIREVWVSFATDDESPLDISRKARRN